MNANHFWQFANRYYVSAILQMKTALSVGSRASLLPAGSDLPVLKTPEGVPFVPGSSLKGAIRFYTERLLRTLASLNKQIQGDRLWACDPFDEQNRCVVGVCCDDCENCSGNCCKKCSQCKSCLVKRATVDGSLDDEKLTNELWQVSCTACRLFGSPWLASRLLFQDAMLQNREAMLRLTEVRDGVGIDRDLGAAKTGIKYDFETVPAGVEFGVHIVVENAEEWEIGLLLLALRALQEGSLPIGGKTSRGLGWGVLRDLKIERLTSQQLLSYLAGQPLESVSPESLQQALITALS